jgi:hypothetical protein
LREALLGVVVFVIIPDDDVRPEIMTPNGIILTGRELTF